MRSFSKAILTCIVVATMAVCLGCSSTTSASHNSNSNTKHSKEYYEGYWACSGYKSGSTTVSFNNLSPEDKKTFPYLDMDLKIGSNASIDQTVNDDGSRKALVMGEWKATSNGIDIDSTELKLDGEKLTFELGDKLLFFEKCISGNQVNVGTITFDGITFDAPIDLAYVHDGVSPDSSSYNIASSHRIHGPMLTMFSRPTDAQDITEMTDYYAGYEDHFVNINGVNYFILIDETMQDSEVALVANGKWYDIDFKYETADPVNYSEYAKTFYSTIVAASV